MKSKKYGHFVEIEKSIYVSDGYDTGNFAIYAWQDLPKWSAGPPTVRCFVEGGFTSKESAELRLAEIKRDEAPEGDEEEEWEEPDYDYNRDEAPEDC